MPGVILSQLEMHTSASAVCALHMYSTLSAVEHAVVAHRDAVIDRDGVEFLADTAGLLDLADHQLSHVLEVDMTRDELSEGVGHRDNGLLEISILHAGGAPQRSGAGHIATCSAGTGTIDRHGAYPFCVLRER